MTLEEIEKEYQEASAHYVNDCIAGWASDHGAKFIALAQHVRVFINACHIVPLMSVGVDSLTRLMLPGESLVRWSAR